MFPFHLRPATSLGGLFGEDPKPNLTPNASNWLARIQGDPADLFFHCVAITHAPRYKRENAGALRQDWPRIPLPNEKQALKLSGEAGRKLKALMDVEADVTGVTAKTIRSELNRIGSIFREGGGSLNPDTGDLDVTAGWGHFGKGGAVMPGKGKIVERDYTADERQAFATGGAAQGLSQGQLFELLGERTLDIYINNVAYWRNVPSRVWEYTIGGYQVIKKWLSYREREILLRGLTTDEMHTVMEISRRIAAILLLEPKLDANYEAVIRSTYEWRNSEPAPQHR